MCFVKDTVRLFSLTQAMQLWDSLKLTYGVVYKGKLSLRTPGTENAPSSCVPPSLFGLGPVMQSGRL